MELQTQIITINQKFDAMLESNLPQQIPTSRWGALKTLYTQAMEEPIPKQMLRPKHPWIIQAILNLLEGRG